MVHIPFVCDYKQLLHVQNDLNTYGTTKITKIPFEISKITQIYPKPINND